MFNDFYLNIQLVDESAKVPTRAHPSDAGLDVYSPRDYVINGNSDCLIPLGWKCEFPEGFALIVQEKSGRAVKDKIDIGAKIIDSNYRSIVHVHLFNNSDKRIFIKEGEKIAQMLVVPIWTGNPKEVDFIDENTDRGTGGFGSTGLK